MLAHEKRICFDFLGVVINKSRFLLLQRGLQNISFQLTDPSAPPGIIEEWKIGGAVGSVNYIFTQHLW